MNHHLLLYSLIILLFSACKMKERLIIKKFEANRTNTISEVPIDSFCAKEWFPHLIIVHNINQKKFVDTLLEVATQIIGEDNFSEKHRIELRNNINSNYPNAIWNNSEDMGTVKFESSVNNEKRGRIQYVNYIPVFTGKVMFERQVTASVKLTPNHYFRIHIDQCFDSLIAPVEAGFYHYSIGISPKEVYKTVCNLQRYQAVGYLEVYMTLTTDSWHPYDTNYKKYLFRFPVTYDFYSIPGNTYCKTYTTTYSEEQKINPQEYNRRFDKDTEIRNFRTNYKIQN